MKNNEQVGRIFRVALVVLAALAWVTVMALFAWALAWEGQTELL